MTKKELRLIEDFAEKIQPVYELLKWTWRDIGVPKVQDIEETLIRLYANLGKMIGESSSGGLFVERTSEEGYVSVDFGFRCDETFDTE